MHLRVFSPQGELLARIPREGDLEKLLKAFGYGPDEIKVERASGVLRAGQHPSKVFQ